MKWLIIPFLAIQVSWAETSQVIPTFLEAARFYVEDKSVEDSVKVLRPDIQAVVEVLVQKNVDPKLLEEVINKASQKSWILPADDAFDNLIEESKKNPITQIDVPEVALHAVRIDVNKKADIFFNDDVYAYFFITDGVIPTGKVTSIYKGLASGDSFFFNELDRAIFPLLGVPSKKPENHLIVDYGIIESDGDDIKKMQQLSSIIIDIAIAVYSAQDPQNAQVIVSLRKEIKALADLLLTLNNDDRLITSSFAYSTAELAKMLKTETFVEIKKSHKKTTGFRIFDYDIHFRLLRK